MAEYKTEVKAPEAETKFSKIEADAKVTNGPVNNRKLEEDKNPLKSGSMPTNRQSTTVQWLPGHVC
jgi:hypothetical protein